MEREELLQKVEDVMRVMYPEMEMTELHHSAMYEQMRSQMRSHGMAEPRMVHLSFVANLQKDGWTLGEFDTRRKHHPHLVVYEDLPMEMRTLSQVCVLVWDMHRHDMDRQEREDFILSDKPHNEVIRRGRKRKEEE